MTKKFNLDKKKRTVMNTQRHAEVFSQLWTLSPIDRSAGRGGVTVGDVIVVNPKGDRTLHVWASDVVHPFG